MPNLIKGLTKKEYTAQYYVENRNKINAQRKLRRSTSLKSKFHSLINNAKQRLDCNLVIDDLFVLWEKQEGLCALSGEEMEITSDETRTRKSTVSLDRIDNSKGYTKNNIQLVSARFNYLRGVHDIDEFIEMCRMVVNYA